MYDRLGDNNKIGIRLSDIPSEVTRSSLLDKYLNLVFQREAFFQRVAPVLMEVIEFLSRLPLFNVTFKLSWLIEQIFAYHFINIGIKMLHICRHPWFPRRWVFFGRVVSHLLAS